MNDPDGDGMKHPSMVDTSQHYVDDESSCDEEKLMVERASPKGTANSRE